MPAQSRSSRPAVVLSLLAGLLLSLSAASNAAADKRASVAGDDGPAPAPQFTLITALPRPAITHFAEPFPGGAFPAANLLDEAMESEYASSGQGTRTVVEFDFGSPVTIAGFRHVDRQDVATIDTSTLTLSDNADFQAVVAQETVTHVNAPGGTTVTLFAQPHRARYVRWQITRLNAAGHSCVGGRDIGFFTTGPADAAPHRDEVALTMTPAVLRGEPGGLQPAVLTIHHPYAEPADLVVQVDNREPLAVRASYGTAEVPLQLPVVAQPETLTVELRWDGQLLMQQQCVHAPVRQWELHFLPHSHVDIGYTHVQTDVERNQWEHLRQALDIARRTADYPPEARFKWNSEVLWAVDSYLQQASDAEREQFVAAVRAGTLHLDALYGNQLTALCRPEELVRLLDCAGRIARQYDVPIDAAMISDVPGYTWGLVPALAQQGVKYLSIGPNHVHRIGRTLDEWGDRPFYWISPAGDQRVLCWMAGKAYSWFHGSRVGTLTRDSRPDPFFAYLAELEAKDYPYDLVQIRYSIGGDNGPPDQELSEFVRVWNERYTWPRAVISTTSGLMRAMEQRYGDRIPEVRGDFTPYWEDGAASSARETSLARMAAERLVQAEILWALRAPGPLPDRDFYTAWRNVLLYNEHTWGAHCSISEPASPFTLSQWQIKQQFAVDADRQSHALLARAAGVDPDADDVPISAVDVWNTCSWPRSDLVVCESDRPLAGWIVRDLAGNTVPSEVTPHGHLAFLAQDVPALAAKRYLIEPGHPPVAGRARADGCALDNGRVRVELDPHTGTIASVRRADREHDVAAAGQELALNHYLYVAGRAPTAPQPSRLQKVEALPSTGLTAALAVHSDAPGARQLLSVVRVVDGLDRVDICNVIDKEPVLEKESVHFGFPFHVPGGIMRIDIPWAVIQPNVDQLPGACKNYFTAGRWVDVSNEQAGVTWATLDAPLLEVGGIHVDVAEPFVSRAWIEQLEPTQTLYSYVMNNYWETNYKASQEGPTTFRYSLLPHDGYDQAAATRFGIERSQPLVVVPVARESKVPACRLQIDGEGVIVTSLKPSRDGGALMLRLFNAGTRPADVAVTWHEPQPVSMTLSSPREEIGREAPPALALPPLGIVTLRAAVGRTSR